VIHCLIMMLLTSAAAYATNSPPVVRVAEQQVFLSSLSDRAVLDASSSYDPDGDPLLFSWRENPTNAHLGLIPIGSEHMPRLDLYFPSPARYEFEVQVSDGRDVSAETRVITVYVPGLKGVVNVTPSDVVRLSDVTLTAYTNTSDAAARTNAVDTMITDSTGRYILENVTPRSTTQGRSYQLRIERDGYVDAPIQQVEVVPDPGPGFDGTDFNLRRGYLSPFRGYVRRTNNAPVFGAIVAVMTGVGAPMQVTTTQFDGSFILSNVPYGSWIMQIRGTGYRPEVRDINIGASTPVLDLHVQPAGLPGTLTGRVTLAGTDRPLRNVEIIIGGAEQRWSGADGTYSFSGIPSGGYVLTAARTDLESLRIPAVNVAGGGTNRLDLVMFLAAQGLSVRGHVTDAASGSAVRLGTVGLTSTGGLLVRSDVTDATGFFQLTAVPAGEQQFSISAPGYDSLLLATNVTADLALDVTLQRSPAWVATGAADSNAPVAAVAQEQIYLTNLLDSFVLDAGPSVGADLAYTWRESPANPQLRRLPAGSETMSNIQVSVSVPGTYIYELQVESNGTLGENTATVTVFAPGLAGNVHVSPTDGLVGLDGATIRAYTNYVDAAAFNDRYTVSQRPSGGAPGDFTLSGLSTGQYWLAAQPDAGQNLNTYGPVRRRVNYSSTARRTDINVSQPEYDINGTVTDAIRGGPVENVRVMVAPGGVSEAYRTTTDGTGAYRLHDVPYGSQTIMLIRDGYQSVAYPVFVASNAQYNIPLTESTNTAVATLVGRVSTDYGGVSLPVAHAEIAVGGGLYRTFTDGEGRYTLAGMPPGFCIGIARKGGYLSQTLGTFGLLQLIPGTNTANVALGFDGHGPVVRGAVVTESGQPVPDVRVTILPPAGAALPAPPAPRALAAGDADSRTDAAGVFQLSGLPEGRHRARFDLPGGGSLVRDVNVTDDRQMQYVAVIPNLIIVAVNILDPSRAPPGAQAVIRSGSGRRELAYDPDKNSVDLAGMVSGMYTVSVASVPGYLPEQDTNTPGTVADPDSRYGNPRHVSVLSTSLQVVVFEFFPYLRAAACTRDGLTGERIPDAHIAFTATSGPRAGSVFDGYPNFASYRDEWFTAVDGCFPTNVILPFVDYDLTLSASGYVAHATERIAVSNASPGDLVEFGTLLMTPFDLNSNGVADAWEQQHDLSNALADADGDGLDNRSEYRCGTDPTNAASVLAVAEGSGPGDGGFTLSWPVAPGRSYVVDALPSLVSGRWLPVWGPCEATGGQRQMSWTDTGAPRDLPRYYRIGVVSP